MVETKGMLWLWPPRAYLLMKNTHGSCSFQSCVVVWFCCKVFAELESKHSTHSFAGTSGPGVATPLYPLPPQASGDTASGDTADIQPELINTPGAPFCCFQPLVSSPNPSQPYLPATLILRPP